MSNIKNFETPADYQSFKGGGEMVKPNVSYVKETNEVHYNPRFAFYFEPGNYYVEEANYLKEIHDSIYNMAQSTGGYVINKYGEVSTMRDGIIANIQNEPYFNYFKKLIIYNRDNTIELSVDYLYVEDIKISYETGYCEVNAPK